MSQFNIRKLLEQNQIIPVVTFQIMDEVDPIIEKLKSQNIHCIEVTLRTPVAFEAIKYIKENHKSITLGVGTVVNSSQLDKLRALEVDFIVSPGLLNHMNKELREAKIPFILGVVTPSEVIQGISLGYDTFKLFPAELSGGIKLLKTYSGLFPDVKFCPTGGINEKTFKEYLDLPNVICVGGSWII